MIREGSALLFRRSSERIKSVLGPDIDAVICDCRSGIAFFAKIIDRQCLPVITAGLHHRYLSGLADEEYLAVGCNRRSEVTFERILQSSMFQYLSGLGIDRRHDPTVLNEV